MKYFKVFNTENEYLEYISSEGCITPYVITLSDSSNTWISGEIHDYSKDYFTIESFEDNNEIKFTSYRSGGQCNQFDIDCSTDGGETWQTISLPAYVSGDDQTPIETTLATINNGDKLLIKKNQNNINTGINRDAGTYRTVSASGNFNVYGNIMSLVRRKDTEDDFTTVNERQFYRLFINCDKIISAENLILLATTLSYSCYQSMFQGCTSLTTAPKLSATTLAHACCYSMFQGCTSLTTAPKLSATTLSNTCYQYMFQDCTSLTTAPELPAIVLADNCYNSMFQGCTSLEAAPELPATTLATRCYISMFYGCTSLAMAPELPAIALTDSCYNSMFDGCTSLAMAPELPATTLANGCYNSMFYGCTSLTVAPELPATTLVDYCYQSMFQYCTSLTTVPELPATTLVTNCYKFMFHSCNNLNYIKCLAIDISAKDCTSNWVQGVSSSGLFVKNSDMANWGTGTSRIPNNWIIKNDGEPIPVIGVFVIGSMYVQTNKTRNLNATVLPTYADNKNLTFESRDTSIVTVDENGVISGVSTGSTTIIVTTNESGFTAQCNVSVIEYSNYTLIKYIESTQTGGQYIETGLKMWETMPVEYEVYMGVNMLGKGKDSNNQAVILGNNLEKSPYPGFVIRKANKSNSIEQNHFPNVASYGQIGEYLDIHQTQSNINSSAHTVTVSLFCGKDSSGTPFRYSRTRLYYCKLRANSSTWQREFVPAKNEQGIVGLLDIVEGEFYKSPNDVEFIGGQKVSQL